MYCRRHNKYVQNGVTDEDVDVAAERKRVLRGTAKKDLLRLENLTKVWKYKIAVTCNLGLHVISFRLYDLSLIEI